MFFLYSSLKFKEWKWIKCSKNFLINGVIFKKWIGIEYSPSFSTSHHLDSKTNVKEGKERECALVLWHCNTSVRKRERVSENKDRDWTKESWVNKSKREAGRKWVEWKGQAKKSFLFINWSFNFYIVLFVSKLIQYLCFML